MPPEEKLSQFVGGVLTVPASQISKLPFVNKLDPEPEELKVTVSFSAFIVVQFVESLLTCHV